MPTPPSEAAFSFLPESKSPRLNALQVYCWALASAKRRSLRSLHRFDYRAPSRVTASTACVHAGRNAAR
jgi:hypothetical protein